MFGLFSNRKKYNGTVDIKINNEYQIKTRDNPLFPSPIGYLELIDNAWNTKMSEDEAAMYIATLYYCGIKKAGHSREADSLRDRIISVGEFGLQHRTISTERSAKFLAAIEGAQ